MGRMDGYSVQWKNGMMEWKQGPGIWLYKRRIALHLSYLSPRLLFSIQSHSYPYILTMHPLYTLTTFFSLSILPFTHTLPTTPPPYKRGQNQNPPLRGPDNLVGYSLSHDVPVKNTSVQYTLVKGQKEDADKGVYLDFGDVGQPQPLRGSLGGTDPGPSRFFFYFRTLVVGLSLI